MSGPIDLSLIVHTRNSARTLPRLLATTSWIPERIAVDMASDDKTVALCAAAGCRVIPIAPSPSVDEVRNRYLSLATSAWSLVLDSDEFLADDAEQQVRELIGRAGAAVDAIEIPRFNYLGDHLLRAPAWYPDKQIRLFRTGTVEWQAGHHRLPVVLNGRDRLASLTPPDCLHIHHSNYRDLFEFVERQARYAVTDTYDGAFDFHAYLAKAYAELDLRYDPAADGDLSAALAILMSWDRIVRGVLHWERIGRSAPLNSAFTLPVVAEARDAGAVAALQDRLAAIENSSSWRITAPLRWLSRALAAGLRGRRSS
ncbi:MAG: glycosyltransferase family 2 protein [Xanthobacteraceae bacterium]|nr:glycosyltransferase family 2 protein [Xanthobacteraceae bacterium]